MAQRQHGGLPAELKELAGRIEQWRSSRTKRTAMPDDLWRDATLLADTYGIHQTAQALRVDYASLGWRQSEAHRGAEESGSVSGGGADEFVEVDVSGLFGSPPAAGAVVSVTDPSGRRLTVQFAQSGGLDLPGLVAAFCEGQP